MVLRTFVEALNDENGGPIEEWLLLLLRLIFFIRSFVRWLVLLPLSSGKDGEAWRKQLSVEKEKKTREYSENEGSELIMIWITSKIDLLSIMIFLMLLLVNSVSHINEIHTNTSLIHSFSRAKLERTVTIFNSYECMCVQYTWLQLTFNCN